jgi:hypothetical protein
MEESGTRLMAARLFGDHPAGVASPHHNSALKKTKHKAPQDLWLHATLVGLQEAFTTEHRRVPSEHESPLPNNHYVELQARAEPTAW